MSGFAFHQRALAELTQIWEHIAKDNLDSADRVVDEIYHAIHLLLDFPYHGHERPDITRKPVRFKVVREYLIIYVPERKPMLIVAIVHGRRSPRVIGTLLQGRL